MSEVDLITATIVHWLQSVREGLEQEKNEQRSRCLKGDSRSFCSNAYFVVQLVLGVDIERFGKQFEEGGETIQGYTGCKLGLGTCR